MNRATPARYVPAGAPPGESGDREIDGRVEAITILTATQMGLPDLTQRIGFWIARRPRWQAENLARSRPQAIQLKRLNFIHAARWVDVKRFPKFPRSSRLHSTREPFEPYQWTLFLSNLNQGWEPYLQAFLDSFGSGIHTIWGESLDYPGYPRPMTRSDLNEWITHRLPPTEVYYGAYPHLTTNDVRCCLRVHRELESARLDFKAIRESYDIVGDETISSTDRIDLQAIRMRDRYPDSNAARLAQAEAQRLAERLQHCLVDLAPAPEGWPNYPDFKPKVPRPEDATGLTGFVSLMPIRRGAELEVVKRLRKLAGPCNDSPFRQVAGTHFARLTVIDRDRAVEHPGRAMRLENSWLLFSADVDARVDEFELKVLKRPTRLSWPIFKRRRQTQERRLEQLEWYFGEVLGVDDLRNIFEFCYPDDGERPDDEEMVDDLVHSILDRRVYFRDYPDVTLKEIVDAAQFTAQLTEQSNVVEAIDHYLQTGEVKEQVAN
jgi:uncharacterized protein (DUF433 family)